MTIPAVRMSNHLSAIETVRTALGIEPLPTKHMQLNDLSSADALLIDHASVYFVHTNIVSSKKIAYESGSASTNSPYPEAAQRCLEFVYKYPTGEGIDQVDDVWICADFLPIYINAYYFGFEMLLSACVECFPKVWWSTVQMPAFSWKKLPYPAFEKLVGAIPDSTKPGDIVKVFIQWAKGIDLAFKSLERLRVLLADTIRPYMQFMACHGYLRKLQESECATFDLAVPSSLIMQIAHQDEVQAAQAILDNADRAKRCELDRQDHFIVANTRIAQLEMQLESANEAIARAKSQVKQCTKCKRHVHIDTIGCLGNCAYNVLGFKTELRTYPHNWESLDLD